MKTSIFLVFFICKFILAFNVCPSSIGVPNGVFERDAAGFYPNDEVVLAADGKKFIPYRYVSGQRPNDISTCEAYTCGRKTFPHGFNIDINVQKPLMLCENHRCLNPEKIKCRKTIEYGACIYENEWVAGLIERKNETKEWLEVECCHYLDNREPVFVKNIVISSTYSHDIVLENGTMIATDYIKDIKKIKDISGQTVFSASIYRMKCDTKNIPEKVPSIFDKAEELKDEDGTGFFENSTKTCEKDGDYRFLNLNNIQKTPTILCFFQKCLNFDKIECKKNVSAENCASKYQWISGFSKHENGSYNVLNVECCRYKEKINPKFKEFVTFHATNITTNFNVKEFGLPIYLPFVNNITVVGEKNGTTLYSASVYHVSCTNELGIASCAQQHQQESLQMMMSGILRRALESAYRNSSKDLPAEYLPLLKEQQKSMTEMFELFSTKAFEEQTKNSTTFFQKQEKELLKKLDEAEKHFSNEGMSLSNQSNFNIKQFLETPKSNVSLLNFLI